MPAITGAYRRILAFACGLSMALVFAIVFVNALRRYSIGKSFPWGEELPIYLTIYGVMFGMAHAYLTDRHIRFTVLTDLLPARVRARLFLLSDAVTMAAGIALAVAGHAFALRRGSIDSSGLKSTAGWLADATGLASLEWVGKVGTWQYAVAIGGGALAIAAALRLADRLSGRD